MGQIVVVLVLVLVRPGFVLRSVNRNKENPGEQETFSDTAPRLLLADDREPGEVPQHDCKCWLLVDDSERGKHSSTVGAGPQ